MGVEGIILPTYLEIIVMILIIETLTGIMTNIFILFVNIQDWKKGQHFNSSDQIFVALSLSNTAFSLTIAASMLCSVFITNMLLVDYIFLIIYFLMTYTMFSSSWLTSWLCLFFCVKIINFKRGLLSWLKIKINIIVPWLILASQLMSFFSSVPLIWSLTKQYAQNSTSGLINNDTLVVVGYKINSIYNAFSLTINCCVPFLIVFLTTGRIIGSLFMHVQHMQQNMGGFSGPNLNALQGAARTMVSLLILYLVFYVLELLIAFLSVTSLLYWICLIVIFSFSAVQSILLIIGNAKLKQASLKILKLCQRET